MGAAVVGQERGGSVEREVVVCDGEGGVDVWGEAWADVGEDAGGEGWVG